MVFHHQVQQVGRLLLQAGVNLLTCEGLVDIADAAPERVVFLHAENGALAAEPHAIDHCAALLVRQHVHGLAALRGAQALVIVVVEQVERGSKRLHDLGDVAQLARP